MTLRTTEEPKPGYRRGVGIMLVNRDGLVFVAQRIDMALDAWQMPQGGIDPGESAEEAAVRELEEEIGTARAEFFAKSDGWLNYDLPPDLQGKAWGGKWRGQTQRWFAALFTGDEADIVIETEHQEFSAWKWIEIGELPQVIVPFKRALYLDVISDLQPKIRRRLASFAEN